MITQNELPDGTSKSIFELDDGATITLERVAGKVFYGSSESFDFNASSEDDVIAKLIGWGAVHIGWE